MSNDAAAKPASFVGTSPIAIWRSGISDAPATQADEEER